MGNNKNLDEIADQLHQLADLLAAGRIEVGGVRLNLSGIAKLKLKQKLEGGKVKVEFSLQADMAEQAVEPAKSTPQDISAPSAEGKGKSKKGRPYEAKKQKKAINSLWKQVCQDINKGNRPDQKICDELRLLAIDYGEGADSQWSDSWQLCLTTVQRAVAAAGQGDFASAAEAVQLVKEQTRQCHKRYK